MTSCIIGGYLVCNWQIIYGTMLENNEMRWIQHYSHLIALMEKENVCQFRSGIIRIFLRMLLLIENLINMNTNQKIWFLLLIIAFLFYFWPFCYINGMGNVARQVWTLNHPYGANINFLLIWEDWFGWIKDFILTWALHITCCFPIKRLFGSLLTGLLVFS